MLLIVRARFDMVVNVLAFGCVCHVGPVQLISSGSQRTRGIANAYKLVSNISVHDR